MNVRCEDVTVSGEACARHLGHTGGCRPMPTLQEMFEFEGREHVSSRWAAVEAEFQIPAIRYQQALNRAIDTREALELDAALTRHLQSRRGQRTRTGRTVGDS